MNNKTAYLAANLIAPGVGQLLAKKWLLGLMMITGGIFCILWFTWEVAYPLYRNMQIMLDGEEMDLRLFNYRNLILSPVFLILIWIISYAEIFLMKDK
ncbi:MAG TPA: hypothetical protein DCZ94_22770 [Lentisphaeria bacterium]|nr:MAG: hypothetical protein A2X48_14010 [Lentisphaerae bacterium GWF2_49_21]HBC89772.1 hypothetical protein [Lentisphaeria bacterium]